MSARSKNFLVVGLLLVGLSSLAQAQNMILLKDINGNPWRTDSYANVKGSPYMTNDWVEGYLRLNKSQQPLKNIQLKFNTYTNELIVLKSNTAIVVSNVTEFGWKGATGDSLKFKIVNVEGHKPGTFFQELFMGENKLYKHTLTTMIQTSAGYSDARKIDEFVTSGKLYIVNTSGSFEIRNKKDLKKALSGYGEKLDKILEARNISIKNDSEVVSLLKDVETK